LAGASSVTPVTSGPSGIFSRFSELSAIFDTEFTSAKDEPMTDMTIELEWTEHASLTDQISDEALEAAAEKTNQAALTFVACTAVWLCSL
jgi:hypothetical protein